MRGATALGSRAMRVLTSKPVLALLALVAIVVVVLLIVALVPSGDDDEAPESRSGTISANDLRVGDCIADARSPEGDVTTFDVVPCDKPHDGEVYTLIKLKGADDAEYPGMAFVNGKGQRGCRARLRRQATARAYRNPRLGYKFVYPTIESWAEGDREITCVATFTKPRKGRFKQR